MVHYWPAQMVPCKSCDTSLFFEHLVTSRVRSRLLNSRGFLFWGGTHRIRCLRAAHLAALERLLVFPSPIDMAVGELFHSSVRGLGSPESVGQPQTNLSICWNTLVIVLNFT